MYHSSESALTPCQINGSEEAYISLENAPVSGALIFLYSRSQLVELLLRIWIPAFAGMTVPISVPHQIENRYSASLNWLPTPPDNQPPEIVAILANDTGIDKTDFYVYCG